MIVTTRTIGGQMRRLCILLLALVMGCLPEPEQGAVLVSILVRPVVDGECLAQEVVIIDDQGDSYQLADEGVCNQGGVELLPGRRFARVFVVSQLALVDVEIFEP